jgi:hypothetical protein
MKKARHRQATVGKRRTRLVQYAGNMLYSRHPRNEYQGTLRFSWSMWYLNYACAATVSSTTTMNAATIITARIIRYLLDEVH